MEFAQIAANFISFLIFIYTVIGLQLHKERIMNSKLLWIIAFACSLFLGQSAFAHKWYCGEKMDEMKKSLHLTSDQEKKIEPIMKQLKTTMKDSATQMKDVSKEVQEQITTNSTDESALDSLVDKKTKIIGAMIKAKIHAKHEIYGLLDDKQKAHYKKMMQEWEQKMADKYKKCKD